MSRKRTCALGALATLVFFLSSAHDCATAQDKDKPVDPNDPRLTFAFPIHLGDKPFRFRVGLAKTTGAITGVAVFRWDETDPLQTLPTCASANLIENVTGKTPDVYIAQILKHADLEFDGYEGLELVQNFNPPIYCVYLWDSDVDRFHYSKELSDISQNLEVHPENKTLETAAYWQGGAWSASTYRWNKGKLELIEDNSLLGDWSNPNGDKCGFTFTCSRLVNGKMVTTFEKFVCTPEEMLNLPPCPAVATSPTEKVKTKANPATK